MTQLIPVQLDENTIIYIEPTENIEAPPATPPPTERTRDDKAKNWQQNRHAAQIAQNFQAIQTTIQTYTNYTLSAFQQVRDANVDKVTLEFGINVGGEAGVPYVTKGTVNSSLKITVECSFPKPSQGNP